MPDGGVEKLPKNLTISDMVDVMDQHAGIMCDAHPDQNAMLICTTCVQALCMQCTKV